MTENKNREELEFYEKSESSRDPNELYLGHRR